MTPDPESFRAPFFSKTHLRNEAEQFRAKYAKESVPVDILAIAEFDLGLEFRPVSSLRRDCDAEAAILGDLQTLLVDMDCYMDERFASRLRFSVAHEIGHFVLHKEVFTGLAHQSVDEWIDFTRRLPDEQYSYLEYHANEFAGRLLVPVEPLRRMVHEAIETARKSGIPAEMLRDRGAEYITRGIAQRFLVSDQVIARRLQAEDDIWPTP